MTLPTKVPSGSLGRIGSLKRISDKSLFPMALGSCGHRITHQLRPINMNGRSILSVTSRLGLRLETNPLDLRVVRVLRNSQAIRAGESLTVRSAARFTPDRLNSTRFGPSGPSKKRQTKPIENSHKPLSLKELTSDGFGILYAKQTQFRAVEAATLEGWPCRKPARRQAWPTLDQAAQTGAEWDRQTRKLDNACPGRAAGRVAGGEWSVKPKGGR